MHHFSGAFNLYTIQKPCSDGFFFLVRNGIIYVHFPSQLMSQLCDKCTWFSPFWYIIIFFIYVHQIDGIFLLFDTILCVWMCGWCILQWIIWSFNQILEWMQMWPNMSSGNQINLFEEEKKKSIKNVENFMEIERGSRSKDHQVWST